MPIENFTFETWIGVAGTIFLIVAYGFLLTGRWRASTEIFRLLTWSGAAAIGYSLAFKHSPALLVVALIWAFVTLVTWLDPNWLESGLRPIASMPLRRAEVGVGRSEGSAPGPAPGPTVSARAAAIRTLDAAIRSLDALSFDVARRPLAAAGAAPVLESMSLELKAIRSSLPTEPEFGSPSFEADNLFKAAENTISAAIQNATGAVPAIEPALSSQLGALRRVLELQRRRLGAPAPLAGPAVAEPAEGAAAVSHEADPASTAAFKVDEAVFVASVMDKLYGSAAFKVIGAALVAAALLAGAGTVYLGSHTMTLRADLEKTEEKGRRDIEASKAVLLAAIEKQHATAQVEIQEKKNDLGQKITDGKVLIDTVVRSFESRADDLKKQIVTGLAQTLGEDLKQPKSEILTAIRKKGEEASNEIAQLATQRIDPLKTSVATIDADVARLGASVRTNDQELQKLAPSLSRLRELEPQLDGIVAALNTVQRQQKELADAVANAVSKAIAAGDQANAAKQAAELAESARQTVLAGVKKLGDEVSDQERSIGALTARFATVGRELDALEAKVRAALPPTVDLAGLGRQTDELLKAVDALKVRVRTLEDLPKFTTAAGSPEFQRQVDEVLRQVSGAKTKLEEIDSAVSKSRTEGDRAASFAREAETAAKQADRERTTAFNAVETVRKDAGNQQRELGRTEKSIETLNKQIEDMRANLSDKVPAPDLGPLNSRLDELKKQVDLLAKRLDDIDAKLKPSPPSFPTSETDLSVTQITAIQRRLADLGFDPKGFDGDIGPRTRGAITAFQRSKGLAPTGTLNAVLIAQLLSPLQVAKP
jgi:predicted  nucleic acid-binding Zn-ribbon protein